MKGIIVAILLVLAICGISWLITCGLYWAICACFDWTFSWGIGTGLWLCFLILRSIFSSGK